MSQVHLSRTQLACTARALVLILTLPAGNLWAAGPRIELEVAMESDFSPTDARAWNDMLGQLNLGNVRLRGAKSEDQPSIRTTGDESSPTYRVLGVLSGENRLILPKARFGIGDRGKLESYFAKLKDSGVEGVTEKPSAFGLTSKQLVSVREALAVPVSFATKDLQPRDAAKRISGTLPLKFITDGAGQRALAVEDQIPDELQGVSAGTALAAILRPLGLVMFPERAGGEVRLRIADSRAAAEHWPVGWPPPGNPQETLPELFKTLNVEIAATPLAEALPAIAGRLKTPILVDHNSLARADIELSTKVDLPMVNTYYDRILDRLLFQAKLQYELRVDEAGKPLLWVTSLQQ